MVNKTKKIQLEKPKIDLDINLDWIDDYQKEIDTKKKLNQTSNKKNKPIQSKSNNLQKKEVNQKLESIRNNDYESESESEAELNKNNKKLLNRFDLIDSKSNSDIDSDSDSNLEHNNNIQENKNLENNNNIQENKNLENNNNNLENNNNNNNLENNNNNNNKNNNKNLENNNKNKNLENNNKNKNLENNNLENNNNNKNLENNNNNKNNNNKNLENKNSLNKTSKKSKEKNQYNFELNNQHNEKTQEQKINQTIFSENIEITINGKMLINPSDIAINTGTKYFVLGQNGIGKTTLLKNIYYKICDKKDVLMIDQDIQIESGTQTIGEFILDADSELYNAKKQLDLLELKGELTDTETDKYQLLSELVYQKEWDKYESESKRIINGLGFNDPKINVSILSGGKRMILAIGKALLRKPDVLMLDEPTNHLDLDVVIWLTNYLESYKKTLIVITHQIGLVNAIGDIIWYVGNPELIGNKIYTIKGKYDKLLKFLEQTDKETNKNYEKFSKKVEELRKKSTLKKDVDEFIKKENVPRPPKPYVVNITFDNIIELSTKNIIEFKEVDFGYLNSERIYKNLDISLSMGSRMILVGPNGCGKTTFFNLISGKVKPSNGFILADERLRVGYYNQQIIDNLPLNLTPIEYLQQLNPRLDVSQCRTILGKLGIKKHEQLDLPTNKISDLSGGQKARVSFASIQMEKPHLILLDEPTNHLDLESIEGLIKGINDFNGGIVIITHDMYLIESIKQTDIYQVKLSNIIKFNGDFEEYCDYVGNQKHLIDYEHKNK